jgi:hypothetical protein
MSPAIRSTPARQLGILTFEEADALLDLDHNWSIAEGRPQIDGLVGAKGNRTPDLSHVVGALCH